MLHDNEKPVPAEQQDTGLQLGAANEVSPESNPSEISLSNAIGFLRWYSPNGPWVLTTYSPHTRGGGFLPSAAENAAAFVQQWDGKQNLYFLLGMPQGKPTTQPKKEAMLGSWHLWVDLDPRARENLNEERRRMLALLTDRLPKGVPAPTCIIDSGRGYWGLWRLDAPCLNPALVEAYNKRLADLFGALGDSCWNSNRVGRLPGTINTKTGERAKVIAVSNACYSLADMPAPVAEKRTAELPAKSFFDFSPDTRSTEDLAELDQWSVPDRVKRIIAQGRDPEEGPKEGDDSRSAWVFDALCQLVRAKVPDEVMLGLLTDPKWGISDSIFRTRDGQQIRNPEKGALRQIENAKKEVGAGNPLAEFECGDNGLPYKSQSNIRTALRLLGVRLRYDLFHDRLLIEGLEGFGPFLEDDAMTRLWLLIDERYRFRAGKDFFWSVVEDTARRDSFHPVLDYLDSLDWDRVPRLDGWLSQYGGAEDTPYTRAVGSLMLVAAVRRVRSPGCKFDEMLVLEGEQGTNKSSALAIMSVRDDWFSDDLPLNADGKRVIESLAGRWILEAAELKGMRKGDVEHLKAFLSRNTDRARMSYDRLSTEVLRQCVIFGTTNSSQYLRDGTGNRRFWPIRIARFDLEALRRDRDQLWAEAAYREAQGEAIRLAPELWPLAASEQQKREVEDPYFLLLQEVLGNMRGKIKASDVWDIIGIPPAQRGPEHNARIGEAMRQLGWVRTKLRFGGDNPEHAYALGTPQERTRRIVVRVNSNAKPQALYEEDAKAADEAF